MAIIKLNAHGWTAIGGIFSEKSCRATSKAASLDQTV
jgi:hypothetical protein